MLLALASDGTLDQATPAAADHHCPGCLSPVVAKCGEQVIWHWAHPAHFEGCDPWAENEGEWHLGWKLQALAAGCELEVTIRRGSDWHRADIVRPDKVVVEVQHSPLGEGEALDRESFYRRHGGLIWLFDARDRWWDKLARYDSNTFFWPGYSETIAALAAPIFWDTPTGLRQVEVLDRRNGQAELYVGPIVGPDEVFVPSRSEVRPVADELPMVAAAEAWHYTAVRCWTCGARPKSEFNDGSPLFTCHHDSPELHLPTRLDGSLVGASR